MTGGFDLCPWCGRKSKGGNVHPKCERKRKAVDVALAVRETVVLLYLASAFLLQRFARRATERRLWAFLLRRHGVVQAKDDDGIPNLDPAHLDKAGHYVGRGR